MLEKDVSDEGVEGTEELIFDANMFLILFEFSLCRTGLKLGALIREVLRSRRVKALLIGNAFSDWVIS